MDLAATFVSNDLDVTLSTSVTITKNDLVYDSATGSYNATKTVTISLGSYNISEYRYTTTTPNGNTRGNSAEGNLNCYLIDETVATASISKGGIKAMLYGQGLAGEGQWDGTIYINEEFTAFTFSSGLSVGNLVDTVSSKLHVPTPIDFIETLSNIGFDSTLSMSDNVVEKIRFKWNDNSYTWGMIVDEFTWDSAKAKTWQELKGVE